MKEYTIPTTSRITVLTAPRQIDVMEVPIPEIGDDEVLVKVEQVGVCGTDVHEYKGDPSATFRWNWDMREPGLL